MIELARHSVLPWECDRNDHLNKQFYVGGASDASAALGAPLALRSGMSAVAGKIFSHAHWLFDVDTGECAATIEAVSVGLDLITRKTLEMTPKMRRRYEAAIVPGLSV